MKHKVQPDIDLLLQSSIHDVEKLFDSLQQMEAALHQTPHKKMCPGTNNPISTLVKDVINDVHSSKNKLLQAKIEINKGSDSEHPSQEDSDYQEEETNHAWSEEDFVEISNKPLPSKKKRGRGRKNKTQPKSKKNGKSRGGYLTLTEELRNKLHRILHEQAQIWYDLYYNPHFDPALKPERYKELITNYNLSKSATSDTSGSNLATTLPSGKVSLALEENQQLSPEPVPSEEQKESTFQDPDTFIKSYIKDDSFTFNQYFPPRTKFEDSQVFQTLIGHSTNFLPPSKDASWSLLINPNSKEEEDIEEDQQANEVDLEKKRDFEECVSKNKKDGNKIVDVALKPLSSKITLTIPAKDIMKYLKYNENYVADENKKLSRDAHTSLIKALAHLTEINEKTLRRIATGGPDRKKGGGRKRMDSEMEQLLASYIDRLNERGRPPTRGEVKNLGQLLTSVPDFRASKGWLDKFLNRIQDYAKGPKHNENLKLLSYADFRRTEARAPILLCLADIGLSDDFIKKFKEMSHEKLSNKVEDVFDANDPEGFLLDISPEKHLEFQKHLASIYERPKSEHTEEDFLDKLKSEFTPWKSL